MGATETKKPLWWELRRQRSHWEESGRPAALCNDARRWAWGAGGRRRRGGTGPGSYFLALFRSFVLVRSFFRSSLSARHPLLSIFSPLLFDVSFFFLVLREEGRKARKRRETGDELAKDTRELGGVASTTLRFERPNDTRKLPVGREWARSSSAGSFFRVSFSKTVFAVLHFLCFLLSWLFFFVFCCCRIV